MGLDCFPQPCACGGHDERQWANAQVHGDDEPCPIARFFLPKQTCRCRLDDQAARELEALGHARLGERMFADMTHDEAWAFARQLDEAADRLEKKYLGHSPKPKGAGWGGTWDPATRQEIWDTHSTFEEAIRSIREAAAWYGLVGEHGYGVHAWY